MDYPYYVNFRYDFFRYDFFRNHIANIQQFFYMAILFAKKSIIQHLDVAAGTEDDVFAPVDGDNFIIRPGGGAG